MKAIQFGKTGDVGVLEYRDIETPSPGPGQVLIKSESISVNFADILMRKGMYPMMPPFPIVPGLEVSGTVEKVGPGVATVKPGDRVVALALRSYAEYVLAETIITFVLPRQVDMDEAVAIPVNYLTAYHMIHSMGHLREGQSVLIYAAAGGVGVAAIQLGKIAGLVTIGLTSKDDKAAFARTQGITHIINYARESVVEKTLEYTGGKGVDLILNSVASDTFKDDFQMLAPLGQTIWFGIAGGPPRTDLLGNLVANFGKGVGIRVFHLTYSVAIPYPNLLRQSMDLLLGYLANGTIRPVIQERIPLAQAARAHQLLEGRDVKGKLILKP